MPTDNQLYDTRRFEMQMFGGNPNNVGYGSRDEISESGGKTIGTIELDKTNKELIVTLNTDRPEDIKQEI